MKFDIQLDRQDYEQLQSLVMKQYQEARKIQLESFDREVWSSTTTLMGQWHRILHALTMASIVAEQGSKR